MQKDWDKRSGMHVLGVATEAHVFAADDSGGGGGCTTDDSA